LKLDKVGTFAKVFINDVEVAKLDNLYRVFHIGLGDLLEVGPNKLRIEIESTVRKTFELRANYTEMYQRGSIWEKIWTTKAWVSMGRTQASDFGWDWSPALAPQGLFGTIQLLSKAVEIEHPIVEQTVEFHNDSDDVTGTLDIYA